MAYPALDPVLGDFAASQSRLAFSRSVQIKVRGLAGRWRADQRRRPGRGRGLRPLLSSPTPTIPYYPPPPPRLAIVATPPAATSAFGARASRSRRSQKRAPPASRAVPDAHPEGWPPEVAGSPAGPGWWRCDFGEGDGSLPDRAPPERAGCGQRRTRREPARRVRRSPRSPRQT